MAGATPSGHQPGSGRAGAGPRARHLRVVPDPAPGPDPDPGLTYVVARTRLVAPGTPFVVAAVLEGVLTPDLPFARVELHDRAEMAADERLADALRSWIEGDSELYLRDRAAYARALMRSQAAHPSSQASG